VGLAIAPASAFAHAGLLSADPAAGARLGASPEAVRLTFSEQPQASLSEIRVLGPAGAPEQLGGPRLAEADPSTLEVPLRRLGKGLYTVSWKVISAVDGHATEGTFAFGVRTSPSGVAATASATTSQSSRLEFLARWIFLLGVIALIGGAVAGVARFGGSAGTDLALAAAGWAVSVVGLALLTDAQRITAASSLGELLRTPVGEALIWRGATLAVAGCALLVAWRRPRARRPALALAAAAALGTVIAHVDAGHAAAGSWSSTLSVFAQVAHFAAAGVWLGGLAALLLGFRSAATEAKERAVRRFAVIALIALLIVFVTGVLRAVDELGAWGDLLDSGYGRAVLAKFVLLALIVAIAARNRPRRAPAQGDIAAVRRRSKLELGLAVVAVGLAALLGTLAPPGSASSEPAGLSASGQDYGTTVRVALTTASDEPGANRFTVRITDYDSGAAIAADRVSLRFTPLDDPSVPPSSLQLERVPGGAYVGSGPNLAFDGRWAVDATIERDESAVEVPLELDLPVPEQFVSVLDIPGSPRPPQYTMQAENGYIRITPDPGRAGRNQIYVHTYTAFENSVPTDQLVVTAAAPGAEARQLPVRRVAGSRFLARVDLPAGPVAIGVFARTRNGERLRGVFAIEIPA
jgi:copper transport protein